MCAPHPAAATHLSGGPWLALTLALAIAGCGMLERVNDCEALVSIVNPELAEVRFQLPDAGADAGAYEQIAGIYERLEQRVAALTPSDPGLSRTLVSYKDMLERAARTSRSYAEELAQPAKSRKARRERDARLERLRKQAKNEAVREASVVRKLNALCQPQ